MVEAPEMSYVVVKLFTSIIQFIEIIKVLQ